ncbi:MAG: ABC transporter substrate-binding protein [Devosia sp.]
MKISLRRFLVGSAVSLVALSTAGAAFAVDLDFMVNGNEDVWTEVVERYKAVAPEVNINLNLVGYNVIRDQLPIQLEAGTGPDMATVTALGALHRFYLDITPYVDEAYWEENYGALLPWYRAGQEGGLYGWHSQVTVTGPYVNVTLFEEAGVELPGEGATWDDWADAAAQVQQELGLYAGMVMDRSGQRFAGPAISYGAQYITEPGGNLVVDDGYIAMAERMMKWHESGLMPPDIWPALAGQAYANGNEIFFAQEAAFYMSGSWNLLEVEGAVGDEFEWKVVPVPCGTATCAAMPGGTGLVSFSHTEHPEEVAAFLNWMAQTENAEYFYATSYQIPAHLGLQTSGVDYVGAGASKAVQDALNVFAANAARTAREAPQAYWIQGDPRNTEFFNATVNYLGAALSGELTLEEAIAKIREQIGAS